MSCDQWPPAPAAMMDCALKLWDKTKTSFLKLHLIYHSSETEIDAGKQGHLWDKPAHVALRPSEQFVGEMRKSLKHWARKALKCRKQSLLSYSDLGWEFGRPEGKEKCKLWSPGYEAPEGNKDSDGNWVRSHLYYIWQRSLCPGWVRWNLRSKVHFQAWEPSDCGSPTT